MCTHDEQSKAWRVPSSNVVKSLTVNSRFSPLTEAESSAINSTQFLRNLPNTIIVAYFLPDAILLRLILIGPRICIH